MEQTNNKKWCLIYLASFFGCIVVLCLITVFIDPYFHYHGPIEGMSYRIYEERYTNDGIARHFDYDTVITGTSMNQNFKPSEWDEMTGSKTVKMPFSGGSFLEIGNNLRRAFAYNENITTVIWGIDYNGFLRPYDYDGYGDYPDYLYDNDIFNDAPYLLNKEILYHGCMNNIMWTLAGTPSTTMDEYSSWELGQGMEAISRSYTRREDILPMEEGLSEEETIMVRENITKNLVELANENPDVTFHFFYTPYSILYWDKEYREGTLLKQLEAEEIATELLLNCPNIKLYSYNGNYELVCDLNNFKDREHYVADVNSQILKWINEGAYLVEKESYLEKIEGNRQFYLNYDYEQIFENN